MLVFCMVIVSLLRVVQGQGHYNDVRCKCVCPRDVLKHNVVVKFVEVEECTCQKLIHLEDSRCLRCKCRYEARNSTLIKVVVIFIIIVLVILIIYMIGLSVHAIWKRKDNLSVQSDAIQESLFQRSQTVSLLDNSMTKWKDSVQDQRRNVYSRHSVLS